MNKPRTIHNVLNEIANYNYHNEDTDNELYTITHNGIVISDFFLDETGMNEVDPIFYYNFIQLHDLMCKRDNKELHNKKY
jgi:hypothetical protein